METTYDQQEWAALNSFSLDYSSNSGVPFSGVLTPCSVNRLNWRSGVRNPLWREQIRNGTNATTPFQAVEYSGQSAFATAGVNLLFNDGTTDSYAGSGQLPVPVFPDFDSISSGLTGSLISSASNAAIRQFISKVNAALSSNNLTGRSIKHLSHDLHSLVHPGEQIRTKISGYLQKLEKASAGRNRRSKSWLNVLREEYLTLTFGLKPFSDDVTAILVDASRRRFPVIPVEGTGTAKTVSDYPFDYSLLINGWPHGFALLPSSLRLAGEVKVRFKGAVRTGSNMSGQIGFIQSQRLLPSDWLPTAFSILPYAWMVNYFTNIGDIIDGISVPFSSLAWSCRTERIRIVFSFQEIPTPILNGVYPNLAVFDAYGYGGNSEFECKKVTRTSVSPIDLVPSFELKVPTRPQQWLNMMAVFFPRISALLP